MKLNLLRQAGHTDRASNSNLVKKTFLMWTIENYERTVWKLNAPIWKFSANIKQICPAQETSKSGVTLNDVAPKIRTD